MAFIRGLTRLGVIAFFILEMAVFPKAAIAVGRAFPKITADAAVLIDASTGVTLFAHNATQRRPPASTTKILTSLLALELGDGEETVTVSEKASAVQGAKVYLQSGDLFYLNDLVKAALIRSGNDAAAAIAEHFGGCPENFVQLMNSKAEILGAWRSCFCNPHGLPDDNHLSTAYDLALIARYALKNRLFAQIVATKSEVIREIRRGRSVYLKNTNRLLWDQPEDIKICGVKTGTTSSAGQCLVAAGKRKDNLLISVVLHSTDRYQDTLHLFDYGFNRCIWFEVARGGEPLLILPVWGKSFGYVTIGSERDLVFAVSPEQLPFLEKRFLFRRFLETPSKPGDRVGCIEVYLKGHLIASESLVVLDSCFPTID
ncbi:MAG: D-alanyl-D-alanine carboxypeptidase DacF [Thermoanaerobacterales bacterium 50_218]|nr:MAG: D-alanyl-D-alanine carboxypeptidase DacF [Thermoanaerobacterales bacterium 50_218]HAA90295.1 D-alanyl-D-alanine carboxypeptidase [Peptococcaceae bacterium]